MNKTRQLTPLQERFCNEYVIDLNATQALIRAGSKAKYPEAIAFRMVKKSQVQRRITALKAVGAKRAGVDQDKVVGAFAEVGFLDPGEMLDDQDNLLPIRQMPLAVRRAIAGFDVEEIYAGRGEEREKIGRVKKIRLCNKNDALDKLAKWLGLFEKDNKQRAGLTIIDIMAIVGVKDAGNRRAVSSHQ